MRKIRVLVVDELRRYGRPQDIPAENLNIVSLIDSALEVLRPRLRDLQVNLNLNPDLPTVFGSPIKLEQALVNLIANAADALLNCSPERERHIDLRACTWGNKVCIRVSDNAGGVPPEVAEKLFKTYVSTKPAEGGTGLGLMITQANIRALGGEVSFESIPGQGTSFTIVLPIEPTKEAVL